MSDRQLAVLYALLYTDAEWMYAREIAVMAGLNTKSMGGLMSSLYYRDEYVDRRWSAAAQLYDYRINDKGLAALKENA